MAGPSRISSFQRLPPELRAIIYTATLEPRVIPLSDRRVPISITPRLPPSPLYLIDKGLYPYRIQSPVAMSVCKESRAIALKSGYQIWTFKNPAWGGTRDLVWNPSVDTILFEQDNLSKLLRQRFTSNLHLVQNMAVTSSLWHWNSQSRFKILSPLVDFEALKEFIVIIEDNYEEYCSGRKSSNPHYIPLTEDGSWTLPQDLENTFLEAKKELMLSPVQSICSTATEWSLPKVRIVRSEEDIVKGVSLETKTRSL